MCLSTGAVDSSAKYYVDPKTILKSRLLPIRIRNETWLLLSGVSSLTEGSTASSISLKDIPVIKQLAVSDIFVDCEKVRTLVIGVQNLYPSRGYL